MSVYIFLTPSDCSYTLHTQNLCHLPNCSCHITKRWLKLWQYSSVMKELTKKEGGFLFKYFHIRLWNSSISTFVYEMFAIYTCTSFGYHQQLGLFFVNIRTFSNIESIGFYSPTAHNLADHKWNLEVKVQLHYAFHCFSSLNPTWVPIPSHDTGT